MKTKILITGIAGFIGSQIAYKLAESQTNIIYGIDNLVTGKVSNVPKKKNIKFIKGDLSKKKTFDKIKFKAEYILHFAGQSSGEKSYYDPVQDLNNNTLTTINLINYGIKCKSKKIVYASSVSVYGNSKKKIYTESDNPKPISCYGISKVASEYYLKVYSNKLPFTILRLFNIFGIGQDMNNLKQGMLSIYIAQAIKNKKIIIKGSLNRVRDFVHIDELKQNINKILKSKRLNNEIINFGTGKGTSVKSALKIIKKKTKTNKIIIEKIGTPFDQYKSIANTKKLKKFGIKIKNNFNQNLFSFIKSSIKNEKK